MKDRKLTISVVDLTLERLSRNPIIYTVEFRHDQYGMSFVVYDIQDSEHDRKSVAADLEVAAKRLQEKDCKKILE